MNSIEFSPKYHSRLYSSISQACFEILDDATVTYAKDRGSRMAKKAKADGCKLNALSYLSYSKLDVPVELVKRSACIGVSSLSTLKDYLL